MKCKHNGKKPICKLLHVMSVAVIICIMMVSISACGQPYDGKYTLTEMAYSDGTSYELFYAFEGTTLTVSQNNAVIHIPDRARMIHSLESLPDTITLLLNWNTYTCIDEDGETMRFSYYHDTFIIESDGQTMRFEK